MRVIADDIDRFLILELREMVFLSRAVAAAWWLMLVATRSRSLLLPSMSRLRTLKPYESVGRALYLRNSTTKVEETAPSKHACPPKHFCARSGPTGVESTRAGRRSILRRSSILRFTSFTWRCDAHSRDTIDTSLAGMLALGLLSFLRGKHERLIEIGRTLGWVWYGGIDRYVQA